MPQSLTTIRELEALAARAWPALHTQIYDGWELRFSEGYTKRNNSINPVQKGVLKETEGKIEYCEHEYLQQGMDVHFRLTKASEPSTIDRILEERGYRRWDETQVQTCDLSAKPYMMDSDFTWQSAPSEAWVMAYCSMNEVAPRRRMTLLKTLQRIKGQTCYGWLDHYALGLAVREGDSVGLFDIVVDKAFRRQGKGRGIVSSLLGWAQAQGAQRAYLQVVDANIPAIKLYNKLGFSEHHRYWYRTRRNVMG